MFGFIAIHGLLGTFSGCIICPGNILVLFQLCLLFLLHVHVHYIHHLVDSHLQLHLLHISTINTSSASSPKEACLKE